MALPHWPLFDLRVVTSRIELRHPTDEDLVAVADLAAGGVHDPATMPFEIPWTDAPQPALQRNTLQWGWRQRADWQPDKWNLTLMVSELGSDGSATVVGVQDIHAD